MDVKAFREKLSRRFEALKAERATMEPLWRELSGYYMPDRGRFDDARPNQRAPSMDKILDGAPLRALRTLAAGMQSGLTSPSRQWFKLTVPDPELSGSLAVRAWCDECQTRMMTVMQGANFYQALHAVYQECAGFGTGCMLVLADYDDVVHCRALTAGEYWLGAGAGCRVDTIYRDLWMTAGQMVAEFGAEACSPSVRDAAERFKDRYFKVRHCIEPDDTGETRFPFRSVYWEEAGEPDRLLRLGGFKQFPAMAPRWSTVGSDLYGRGPGFENLADTKALQVMKRDLLTGIKKNVDPPLVGDASLRGMPMVTTPSGVTYVPGLGQAARPLLAPLYQPTVGLQELAGVIQEAKSDINEGFYVNLFLMLQQDDRPTMTAREVVERHEEKLIALGPVLERLEWELLTPAIDRVFDLMEDVGLIPEPPEELAGRELKIEYVSMLAQAQRMIGLKPVEQLIGFVGNVAGAQPDVLDAIDIDATVREYADLLGVPAKILRDPRAVDVLRQQRAQAQQQAAQMEQAQAAAQTVQSGAQGAKLLSEADMGPDSALGALLGTNAGGGVA